jgi:hypothetical protein
MEITISISCCLCSKELKQTINLPDGWAVRYDSISTEVGFCEEHFIISKFAESQCPGCVGGWADCDLWRNFAYREHNLTEKDFETLSNGICPKRTNGTMVFDTKTKEMEQIDLRGTKNIEAGIALAKAIKDYWIRYP